MKKWKRYCWGLAAVAGFTPSLWAQDLPPVPTVPSPATAAAGIPAATPAPSPGGHTLWSFLGLSGDQKAACKLKLCQTPFGQLLNNTMKPFGALSGGLMQGICPAANPADLLKPPTSAEGAAARIQASEADAKARRAAIRYLGTVDCQYWPEAEEALAKGLRADTNECVRYEAALALNRGCCCTKKIIAALTETVEGGKKLGPAERSERVKDAAVTALEHCLACVPPEETPQKPRDVTPQKPGDQPGQPASLPKNMTRGDDVGDVHLAAAFVQIEATPMSQLRDQARRALVMQTKSAENVPVAMAGGKSERSLYNLLVNARFGASRPSNMQHEESVEAKPAPVVDTSSRTVAPVVITMPAPDMMPGPVPPVRLITPAVPEPQSRRTSFPSEQAPPLIQKSSAQPAAGTTIPMAPFVQKAPVQPTAAATTPMAPLVQKAPAQPTVVNTSPITPMVQKAPTQLTIVTSSPMAPLVQKTPTPPTPVVTSATASIVRPAEGMVHVGSQYTPLVVQVAYKPDDVILAPQSDIAIMRESLPNLRRWDRPELREQAAVKLQTVDWRTYPEVVDGLVTAAVEDSSASVRVACVKSLAKMNVRTSQALATLEKLKNDREPTVRDAAAAASLRLKAQ